MITLRIAHVDSFANTIVLRAFHQQQYTAGVYDLPQQALVCKQARFDSINSVSSTQFAVSASITLLCLQSSTVTTLVNQPVVAGETCVVVHIMMLGTTHQLP